MTPLRRRMIDDLQMRNYSPRTISAYVGNVARFARYYGRSPEKLGPEEVRRYLIHLVEEQQMAWDSYRQVRPHAGADRRSAVPRGVAVGGRARAASGTLPQTGHRPLSAGGGGDR